MNVEKNFLLLCENFLLDDKQRASLINLYDIIWANQLPAVHPKLLYVANVRVTDSGNSTKLELQFKLVSPSGKEVFAAPSSEANIVKNSKFQTVGGVFEVNFIPFDEYGTYKASLLHKGKEVANHMFDVRPPLPAEA